MMESDYRAIRAAKRMCSFCGVIKAARKIGLRVRH